MPEVMTTGPYLYSDPAIDNDIDYLQFLTLYFKKNPKWRQLFTAIGNLVENVNQPAINELAKIRDPANPDTDYIMMNTRMMGFNIPNTSFEGNEAFRTMDTLGVFYITRNASYSFINYLSFIKNTLLEPMPLWANSPTASLEDLVYQSQIPAGQESSYFPTVFYDVQYTINDFIVDESVIQQFIIALQPAHLVFRQFNAIYAATATIATKPVSQIFSYIGTLSANSPIPT